MTISISQLESIRPNPPWVRDGERVNIGTDVALFQEECDAEDACIAVNAVNDTLEILEAAKRWSKSNKRVITERLGITSGHEIDEASLEAARVNRKELDEAARELMALIDKVRV